MIHHIHPCYSYLPYDYIIEKDDNVFYLIYQVDLVFFICFLFLNDKHNLFVRENKL